MKKYSIILLILITFLLSSCSGGFGSIKQKPSGPEEITSGDGLVVKFRTNKEWMPEISYELELIGEGKIPIELTQENFELITTFQKQEIGSAFTSESIDEFYDNVFSQESELELVYDRKIKTEGVLEIDEEVYNNLNLKSFEYLLKINYDYKTEFTYNLELDLKEKELTEERTSQAAPIKITDIELFPRGNDEYRVLYYLQDRGQSSGDKTVIIDSYTIYFGDQDITSNCNVYTDRTGENPIKLNPDELKISKTQRELIFSCEIDTSRYIPDEKVRTKTYGEFEYNYEIEIIETITLPEKRTKGFE